MDEDDDTETTSDSDDTATCDICEKSAPYGDADCPVGWWLLEGSRTLPDGTGEEDDALVCSPDCGRRWLAEWAE